MGQVICHEKKTIEGEQICLDFFVFSLELNQIVGITKLNYHVYCSDASVISNLIMDPLGESCIDISRDVFPQLPQLCFSQNLHLAWFCLFQLLRQGYGCVMYIFQTCFFPLSWGSIWNSRSTSQDRGLRIAYSLFSPDSNFVITLGMLLLLYIKRLFKLLECTDTGFLTYSMK